MSIVLVLEFVIIVTPLQYLPALAVGRSRVMDRR
jgi:hypothetical protein